MSKTLKKLFNDKKKAIREAKDIGFQLDQMIVEKWGFHYSETDDDMIIDTLDYGTSGINFEYFESLMDDHKANRENSDDDDDD